MNYLYVTNFRHLIPENPTAELPNQTIKLRQFLSAIIKAATASQNFEFLSGLSCRKRVNRKPCQGAILIKRQDIPKRFIFWHCDKCEDGGRISDFEDTYCDLSRWKQQTPSDPGDEIVEVIITREQYRAFISPNMSVYDPDSEKIIFSAVCTDDGIILKGFEGDMDNFIGYIAADLNHEPNQKRKKLVEPIYNKIQYGIDSIMDNKEISL